MSVFIVGLDLAQASDYTALAVLEQTWPEIDGIPTTRYDVRHLERMPLGTSYPDVVKQVSQRVRALTAMDASATLVVDQTGVGRPVVDLLRDAALPCHLVPIMITGGQTVTQTEEQIGWVKEISFHVPKRDLVGVLAVLFQSGRVRIAQNLSEAQILIRELLNFRVKISLTGRDSYGAGEEWRDGAHDDLVLATALAAWYGEHAPTPPMGVLAFGAARIKPVELGMSERRRSWR